ncbi:MAG: penicillin acylase family protein, partial [Alphaproteobacteria bacterium]
MGRIIGRRGLRRLAVGLVAALAASGLGVMWLRSSLPPAEARIEAPGVVAPVTIARDEHGIGFITAGSEHDAYFALGFAHAQDRLFQMDFMRRAAAGRLSELLGPQALPHDRLMRVLGLYRLAEANLAFLSEPVRAALQAYSDGVNAYLRSHAGAWPVEYYLLGTRPEPWRPQDSLAWGRLMTLRLSVNSRQELLRARLASRLTPRQIQDLWPIYPLERRQGLNGAGPSPAVTVAGPMSVLDRLDAALASETASASASNSFAVDGRHSASGKPLLASDPHLALEAPGVWYLVRVEAPGMVWAGATAPGVPFLILGHNGHVAWGMTSTENDTQDLYYERVDPADPGRYMTPEGPRPFTTRGVTIRVKGGADVHLAVRETRHGPVITDAIEGGAEGLAAGPGTVLALADAALRPDVLTAQALYRLNHAKDAAEVAAALADFQAPQQNVVFADVEGTVGFHTVGRAPVRPKGDGTVPVPGWEADYDWTGFVPYDELPHALDPPSGRVIAANHNMAGDHYPHLLGAYWPAPYRARRIAELLDRSPKLDPLSAGRIQLDAVSPAVPDLLPLLLAVPATTAREAEAVAMLRSWDGTMSRRRPEPLLYSAWLLELTRVIAADELGPFFASFRNPDPLFLQEVLTERQDWCDDLATGARESCGDAIATALASALDKLTAAYGRDMTAWHWGRAHRARFLNHILGHVPLIGPFLEPVIGTDGDDTTVNRGTYAATDAGLPFVHRHGAGLRAVYDLADLDGSLFALAPGQSGNILSAHYQDT